MIYSFYDPAIEDRTGLGNFVILDHIERATKAGLPYVYLGYWVEGSPRMQYKVRFRPLDVLGAEGWRRLGDDEQRRLIENVAKGGTSRDAAEEGSTKDPAADLQREFKLA